MPLSLPTCLCLVNCEAMSKNQHTNISIESRNQLGINKYHQHNINNNMPINHDAAVQSNIVKPIPGIKPLLYRPQPPEILPIKLLCGGTGIVGVLVQHCTLPCDIFHSLHARTEMFSVVLSLSRFGVALLDDRCHNMQRGPGVWPCTLGVI